MGLEWSHSQTHLYRVVLESVALEYAIYQRIVLELFGPHSLKELRITGGGEKSGLWNQIKSDILQRPVRRLANADGIRWARPSWPVQPRVYGKIQAQRRTSG